MAKLIVVSHPEVVVAADVPVPDWGLSEVGRTRAAAFAKSEVMYCIGTIWASTERKARDTAMIISEPTGLDVKLNSDLGENDRSATGFLPPDQFQAAADTFFAEPDKSFRGWETARAAQARMVTAVMSIIADHDAGDLVISTHGGVGTLLWCHLAGEPINREFDQPGQGNYWTADLNTLRPDFRWRSIT